jgi:hypothetical protein
MKTTTMEVTPSLAQQWLAGSVNHDNRTLSSDNIQFLAGEIRRGKWRTTHQGIAFSTTGRLMDGQHRLYAIIEANMPVRLMVTDGLDDEDFRAMDVGWRRAMKDRVHLVDNQNRNQLMCMAISSFLAATTVGRGSMSAGAVEDEFLAHAEAWMWIGGHFDGCGARLRPGGIMAALAMYYHVEPDKAQSFLDAYLSGAGLEVDSPIMRMRNDALGINHNHGHRAIDYWRAVSVLQYHREARSSVRQVFAAAVDMVGNENTSKQVVKRSTRQILAQAKVDPLVKSAAGKKAALSMSPEVRHANAVKAGQAAQEKRRKRLA